MRKLMAALSLGCVLSIPAVAADWTAELDHLAGRFAPPGAPRSPWGRDTGWAPHVVTRDADPIRAFAYAGDGWATLDGWMRRDLLLRQWIAHRFDTDGDGALSTGEAAQARDTFYALADTNRSGIITSEEFLSGWGTVRAAIASPYAPAG